MNVEQLKRPRFVTAIRERLRRAAIERQSLPAVTDDSQDYVEQPPEKLSPKAREICIRRRYGGRVARAFKIYGIEGRMPYLSNIEFALLRNMLGYEYITNPQEKTLVAATNPEGPVPKAYQEVIDFYDAQREDFAKKVKEEFGRHNAPPGILEQYTPELVDCLKRIARGIRLADLRDQPLETRNGFVGKAMTSEEEKIIDIHRLLDVYRS